MKNKILDELSSDADLGFNDTGKQWASLSSFLTILISFNVGLFKLRNY